jgi:hypothetical protein
MACGLSTVVWEPEDLLKLVDSGAVEFVSMKCFGRWLFNALVLQSLLLAIFLTYGWKISFRDTQVIAANGLVFAQGNGQILIGKSSALDRDIAYFPQYQPLEILQWGVISGDNPPDYFWRLPGIRYDKYSGPPTRWAFVISHWYFVSSCLILPALFIARWISDWRKIRKGGCVVCGYDLRATPDRCPECGTIPPLKEPISN